MDPRSSWQSLRVRLPAGIVVLLSAALVSFALSANREVETALLEVAESGLRTASEEIESLLAQSQSQQIASLDSLAARPAVVGFLTRPGAGTEAAARRLLDSLAAEGDGDRAVALLDASGVRVLSGDSALGLLEGSGPAPTPGVGRFVEWREHVAYRVVSPVVVAGDTLGHLLDVRAVESNPEGSRLIADLIGTQAAFAIGTDSGGPWTDLGTQVPAPPPDIAPGNLTSAEREDGEEMVGILTRIGEGPWMLWVALPRSAILGPQRAFVARMGTVGLALVLVGGLGGWLLSHRIVGGLGRLTATAEAIAHGEYGRRFQSAREDEVGRLGRAFDSMADEVQTAHDLLEERVRKRTEELEAALRSLEEAQAELVRKERLAMLGELAGGVGHELRNPLGVMTNAVYFLRTVLQNPPDGVTDYLDILQDQIQLSEKIVRDLLDFARVRRPSREETTVRNLVQAQLSRAGDLSGVRVEWDLPEDLPPVYVDPGQVGQVVLNIVTNAKQAMSENGAGSLLIRARADGDHVSVAFTDNGPGVPREAEERIFEPLFTTKARGIGLGLSVSRSLVEANGGSLELDNRPGVGATFVARLPLGPDAVTTAVGGNGS